MVMKIRKNLRWQDYLTNVKILIAHHRQEGKVGTPTREFRKNRKPARLVSAIVFKE